MIKVQTFKVQEAAEEMKSESPEEEFGLVEGPLGHLLGVVFDEEFFNAAFWETANASATASATASANEPLALDL